MSEKQDTLEPLKSIMSNKDPMEPEAHQVDLNAFTSHQISLNAVGQQLTEEQKFIILKRLNFEGLVSLEDLPVGATFMIEKIQNMVESEAVEILKQALVDHDMDPNFPSETHNLIESLLNHPRTTATTVKDSLLESLDAKGYNTVVKEEDLKEGSHDDSSLEGSDFNLDQVFDWPLQVKMEAALIEYYSPYPEVRAVTDCYDDPSIYCETPRVYVLGLIWTAIGTFVNEFFYDRQPPISLTTSVIQLFLYPSGLLLAAIVPKWKCTIWQYTFDFNPGPWNAKEQLLATIFFSISSSTIYTNSNITVQKLEMFFNNDWATWGYQILLGLSTEFIGFGFAGLMRKFSIYPVRSVWPTVLPTLALNQALLKPEKKEVINGWKLSRYSFFFLFVGISFLYFWLPDYLMQFLLTFNWMTWIKPENRTLAEITGSVGGLGMNPIPTFDWNIINYASPLVYPFYTQVNQFLGVFLGFFIIVGVYYSNNKWTGFLPINTNRLFNNRGESYVVEEILDERSLFEQSKYDKYGPPYYSAANLVVYGSFFAIYPFGFIYECFNNYKQIWQGFKQVGKTFKNYRRSTYAGYNDPHTRMMSQYKEVPDWAFLAILIIAFVFAVVATEAYPAQAPVWAIVFVIAINFVFLIPLTTIRSVTGFSFYLNVLVELIIGYALPGNAMALVFLKALGTELGVNAEDYFGNQKLAHYAKIPPRAVFRCQVLSMLEHVFISLAVVNYKISSFDNYCAVDQKQKFSCPNSNTYFSAAVVWGTIGPKRVFGGLYPILQWCFLIGALLPIPCILFRLYGPQKIARSFQPTVLIGGLLNYAPYNLSYFTGGLYVSITFMYYIKRHYLTWWEKYNYVLSGALNAGIAFSAIIIFFAVQYHDKSISWWGNNVMYEGMDNVAGGVGRLNATISAPEGYFGPRKGNFP